jgi:4'-phosphopantetheinyl transferase
MVFSAVQRRKNRYMAHVTIFDEGWPLPRGVIELNDNEIHVWSARIPAPGFHYDILATNLSEEERERAARFKFGKDLRLYIVSHSALRSVLAGYLHVSAADVKFVSTAHGKPVLAAPLAASGIEFNLSHSHEMALIGVARGKPVGIDVEFVRPDFAFDEMARRFFTAKEVAALDSLPQPLRQEAFFKFWTAKEAYLKAKGTGLTGKLDEVEISFTHEKNFQIKGTVPHWSLVELPALSGYQSAVVSAGDTPQIKRYQWRFGCSAAD